MGAAVWSPLGWGRLTGKFDRKHALPDESRLHKTLNIAPPVADDLLFRVLDVLSDIAAETGKLVPQIALNWLLQRPTVSTIIIGARTEEQLKQNFGAVGWKLDIEQIARLDAASTPYPLYPQWHQRSFMTQRIPPAV